MLWPIHLPNLLQLQLIRQHVNSQQRNLKPLLLPYWPSSDRLFCHFRHYYFEMLKFVHCFVNMTKILLWKRTISSSWLPSMLLNGKQVNKRVQSTRSCPFDIEDIIYWHGYLNPGRFAPLNRYYIIIDEVFFDNFLVLFIY
jgi:hypothetical protein